MEDMIWAQKLAKANTSARGMLNKARRLSTDDDGSVLKVFGYRKSKQIKEDSMVQMILQSGSAMIIDQMIGDKEIS